MLHIHKQAMDSSIKIEIVNYYESEDFFCYNLVSLFVYSYMIDKSDILHWVSFDFRYIKNEKYPEMPRPGYISV